MLLNSLIAELNPVCHLLALLGAHHILHVSRIRVNNKYYFAFREFRLWKELIMKTKYVDKLQRENREARRKACEYI